MALFSNETWDDERFPGFVERMNTIYQQSLSDYPSENDRSFLTKLFKYLEFYYASILKQGFVKKSNFSSVLEQLKGIQEIKILAEALRPRINGITYKGYIVMNPTPGCYQDLDQESSLQDSFFHELGHILTSMNHEDLEYLQKLISGEEASLSIQKGFELLDEVTVEYMANCVYNDLHHLEPREYSEILNRFLLPNGTFHSNLLEYCEFQELAYDFIRCFEFLSGEDESMEASLKRYAQAAISREFCTKFYNEIVLQPEKMEDVRKMLKIMGKVKDAKYTTFGLGLTAREDLDVTEDIAEFKILAEKNRVVSVKPEEKVQS